MNALRELDRSEAELLGEIRRVQRESGAAYATGARLDALWASYCDLSAPGDGCPVPAMYRRRREGD